jgi:Cu/Ag efflux protein CusF
MIESRALPAFLLAAALTAPALAAPEKVRANIVSVDWKAMKMVVKHPTGYTIDLSVPKNTPVKFSDGAEFYPDPTVEDLAPGMYIHFIHDNRVVQDVIEVREISAEQRRPRHRADASSAPQDEGRTLKVRILSVDERRGQLSADVAGRRESFRVSEPRTLRRYEEGDMVILTVVRRGGDELVTEIRSASLSGRVLRVDRRRGEIAIDADGRQETYRVEDKSLLEQVREGDRIRFEFEDRRGTRNVITAIH